MGVAHAGANFRDNLGACLEIEYMTEAFLVLVKFRDSWLEATSTESKICLLFTSHSLGSAEGSACSFGCF